MTIKFISLFFVLLTLSGGRSSDVVYETESNNHLPTADHVGFLQSRQELKVAGEIHHPFDVDSFRFDVRGPVVIDITVLTSGSSLPLGGPGSGSSLGGFLPLIYVFDAQGRLLFWHQATLPNLKITGLPIPPGHGSFTLQLIAGFGRPDVYTLKVGAK